MYIEHPFKYNGVYYAKIDGELIEITREQAKAMLSFYRNSRNYDKRWGYKGNEEEGIPAKKDREEADSCADLREELDREEKDRASLDDAGVEDMYHKAPGGKSSRKAGKKKRRMVIPREIMLDCVFRENSNDLSVQDLPGEDSLSTEALVMKKLEYQELHEKISRLSEQDQYIINEIYFKGMHQVEVARAMGISPQSLHNRLKYSLIRLRRLYVLDQNDVKRP